ncbi:C39 family peptidase [Crenobacter cavernae]|uniref:Peptidase C39 n=1 Tax=Crenobacter cavernae TaxID=2290923 RepID=A0ABY0FF49_9NEIS|nr:C39 family peptidase [Crenobacter cavernae]RXZ44929.1 peptidase C39 [Crenobacter cavernae]
MNTTTRSLFAALAFACCAPSQAASLMVPAFTGDATPTMRVTSLREARFANVIEQKTDFSCGAAALGTLLNFAFGKTLTESDVIAGMMIGADQAVVHKMGFSLLDMKRYVQRLGLRASGFAASPEKMLALKIPAIVLLNVDGYRHFVVIRRYTPEKTYIADPAMGNRTIPTEQFNKQWNGILLAVAGPGYRLNTPLRAITPVLSARNMVNEAYPAQEAELLEYGFSHSDFF